MGCLGVLKPRHSQAASGRTVAGEYDNLAIPPVPYFRAGHTGLQLTN